MDEKFDALVLRTADYGEYDRMLTLFTLQKGKLSAAAKGVRRAGAKLRFAFRAASTHFGVLRDDLLLLAYRSGICNYAFGCDLDHARQP